MRCLALGQKTLAAACLFVALSAHGMNLTLQGHTLFASGPVDDDYRKFSDALEQEGVQQVVFVNSPGDDLWTGMRVGRLMAQKALKLIVAGSCVSACSIMFMGGRERTFSDAFGAAQTFIGIHGPHNKLTRTVNPEQAVQIYAFFQKPDGRPFQCRHHGAGAV
jgi:hypothetical protein